MDTVTRNFTSSHAEAAVSRRRLNRLAGLGFATLVRMATAGDSSAKKKKVKKVTLCLDGQTLAVKKNKQKPLLARGATPGACQTPSTCLRPSDNLQAAVAAASSGASLQLCAGTWSLADPITIDKSLTLIGAGAEATVLDGRNILRPLRINAGTTVTLQDFTVTRGQPPVGLPGGGIRNAGDLTLRGVVVSACAATSGGGIYSGNGSSLTLTAGSRVRGNRAGRAGGGILSNSAEVVLEACELTDNTADDVGGGIASSDGSVTLKAGCIISGNTGIRGGGIDNGTGAVVLEADSDVSGNTTRTYGGGIFSYSGPVTLKANSKVTGNTATNDGGGVWTTIGTVTRENDADLSGNTPNNCATSTGTCP